MGCKHSHPQAQAAPASATWDQVSGSGRPAQGTAVRSSDTVCTGPLGRLPWTRPTDRLWAKAPADLTSPGGALRVPPSKSLPKAAWCCL